ncbi:alkaline shock response membrane anchor protein AmaP [Streptomyces sp. AJS327]|uniref:alkaline shock response membrane anchor protein AmaP n=1 Tax=Streptomyces sp. AJS327 TaxID=2545265 RepID=UPI0015DF4136|nr:alkaline shock response membrane anchor protein AmaP [Streptomyces sp. AJS327]MBA0050497.1 alkaline shock response membrane anchor protein AmaP [Streptomyces sp. AJS327]
MLRVVNRVLLGLTGLLSLAVGLALLAGGFELPHRWGLGLPSDWPWARGGDVPLAEGDRTRWRDTGWWWPVVIGVLSALVLLTLWWVLAQARRRRLGEVLIAAPEGSEEGVAGLLRGRALEDALTADAEGQPGVERARVTLTGRRTGPRTRIGLLLAPHAEPGPAVRQLHGEALEHARSSIGVAALPAEVRLRSARHRARRVV